MMRRGQRPREPHRRRSAAEPTSRSPSLDHRWSVRRDARLEYRGSKWRSGRRRYRDWTVMERQDPSARTPMINGQREEHAVTNDRSSMLEGFGRVLPGDAVAHLDALVPARRWREAIPPSFWLQSSVIAATDERARQHLHARLLEVIGADGSSDDGAPPAGAVARAPGTRCRPSARRLTPESCRRTTTSARAWRSTAPRRLREVRDIRQPVSLPGRPARRRPRAGTLSWSTQEPTVREVVETDAVRGRARQGGRSDPSADGRGPG